MTPLHTFHPEHPALNGLGPDGFTQPATSSTMFTVKQLLCEELSEVSLCMCTLTRAQGINMYTPCWNNQGSFGWLRDRNAAGSLKGFGPVQVFSHLLIPVCNKGLVLQC